MRLAYLVLIFGAVGLASCKKDEAPASEAPQSQAMPAPDEKPAEPAAPAAPGAAAEAAPTPMPAPTVGSTKEDAKDEGSEKRKDALAREPSTLAEAEKLLDTAALDLNKLVGAKGAKVAGATPLAAGDTRCPEACKAMTSLRRAAAAVCRLAGEANSRCSRAKDIVKDSESRVTVCKCED